jgi:hypothetical protein
VRFVVDKVALGQVFSEYFGLPCQFSFRRLLQSPSSIIWGWYNRPISDRRTKWTQSHPHPKKLKEKKILGQHSFFGPLEFCYKVNPKPLCKAAPPKRIVIFAAERITELTLQKILPAAP